MDDNEYREMREWLAGTIAMFRKFLMDRKIGEWPEMDTQDRTVIRRHQALLRILDSGVTRPGETMVRVSDDMLAQITKEPSQPVRVWVTMLEDGTYQMRAELPEWAGPRSHSVSA